MPKKTTKTANRRRPAAASKGKVFIADSIERVKYKSLIPADYNPRTMDARSLRVLMGSLMRFGWVMPVVINRRTGNIKFYAPDEFRRVLQPYFGDIRQAKMEERDSAVVMVCRKARAVRRATLDAALRFEFDLKIDGQSLDRSEAAVRAFAAYLRPRR